MSGGDTGLGERFDPAPFVPVLELPEGIRSHGLLSRLFLRGERAYDPLWRYVRRVDRMIYLGQGPDIRFGKYDLGMRDPHRIPTKLDFVGEILYVGRKLTIPFSSLRSLLVAHGLMPDRKVPVFALLVGVDGCNGYLPLHRCAVDRTITDLAEFASQRLRVPLGVASRPLGFLVEPGAPRIRHAGGETPLYELRAVLSIRDPEGRTAVRLLAGERKIELVEQPDPLGWIERWGIIADELLGIAARRARSRYGRDLG